MKRNSYFKVIAVGILVVLVGGSVVSTANSINNNVCYEETEKYVVKPFDDNREIITRIDGSCTYVEIHSKRGIVYDVTFNAEIWGTYLDIDGWMYPFPSYFHELVTYLHTPLFIGFIHRVPGGWTHDIRGIALGNIEWS